jgi:argininosuccinate lyase
MAEPAAGRLTGVLSRRAQALLYDLSDSNLVAELTLSTEVDLAHIAMLVQSQLLDRRAAAELLRLIAHLRETRFHDLLGRPAPRGIYLMYEQYLIERLGEETAGMLHTARSRNDMKATTTAMRLRSQLIELVSEAIRLQALLLAGARRHRTVVMPVYTHYQPAMPITYGYYLLGVALALGRDIAAVQGAARALDRCPMGACAVAGTDLPIDAGMTARLLGFTDGPIHATDAVASRDAALRTLSAVAGMGITISRFATDLQLWSTSEFGLITFPDWLVGGSSAMPQKRNAFLLEHLKAKADAAIGAWTAAAGMTASIPFTNSIEVGTEAVDAVWPGLAAVITSIILAQEVTRGAAPAPDRMRERAEQGFTTATVAANHLVRLGVPFRAAHTAVGAAVRKAVGRGSAQLDEVELPDGTVPIPGAGDVVAAVTATRYGGGPGAFQAAFEHAVSLARAESAHCAARRERIDAAGDELRSTVAELSMAAVIEGRRGR